MSTSQMMTLSAQPKHSHRIECDREEEWNRVCDESPREQVPSLEYKLRHGDIYRHAAAFWIESGVHELRTAVSNTEY